MGQILSTGWQPEHSEALVGFIASGLSYAETALAINEQFGTKYSRNAAIGKAGRMKIVGPVRIRTGPRLTPSQRYSIQNEQRKQKRWQANPSLAERAEKIKQSRATRARMLASNTSRTSPAYRKHMPKQAEMTRNEMRAMLTDAVRNTAALVIA